MKKNYNFIFLMIFFFLYSSCDDNVNDPRLSSSEDIFVIEKDHLFGGFGGVDIYHNTFIMNTGSDSILVNVESPTPEGLKRESDRSPAFGKFAYIPTDFSKHFNIPNMANDYLTNEPDTSTQKSHFWNNLKLGPKDAIHVPYSNYYGEGQNLFVEELGVNRFMDLKIIYDYSIKKHSLNPVRLSLSVKVTMQNCGERSLYTAGVVFHVPKELWTSIANDTINSDTKLYNLIEDQVKSSSKKISLIKYSNYGEGFGFYRSSGQTIEILEDILPPNQSYSFEYSMIIEPVLEKFEIYPMHHIYFEEKGEKVWPESKITVNGANYNGQVNYLKVCGLAIPTYILFSINGDELKVVGPDEIEPTFKP